MPKVTFANFLIPVGGSGLSSVVVLYLLPISKEFQRKIQPQTIFSFSGNGKYSYQQSQCFWAGLCHGDVDGMMVTMVVLHKIPGGLSSMALFVVCGTFFM